MLFCAIGLLHSIWRTVCETISASQLNTPDVGLSLEHKFSGKLKHKNVDKVGFQAYSSLSLIVDDVERLHRDLYGDSDAEATDRVRNAVFRIVRGLTKHLRKDLYKEHADAQIYEYDGDLDIGMSEEYGVSAAECRDARRAISDIARRAHSAP